MLDELDAIVAEGMQVLEHEGLIRARSAGGDWTATRLGRDALAQNWVPRALALVRG